MPFDLERLADLMAPQPSSQRPAVRGPSASASPTGGVADQLRALMPIEMQQRQGEGGGGGGGGKPIRLTLEESTRPITRDDSVVPDDEFGITHIEGQVVPGSVRVEDGGDHWAVTAQARFAQNWGTKQELGPDQQVSINSAEDPDLHQGNCQQAADDLTPDAVGLAPRTQFWAQDLTEEHERFHQRDNVPLFDVVEQNWRTESNKRTAPDAASARLQVQLQFNIEARALSARTEHGSSEQAARDAVAPRYAARAQAIRERCAQGAYPAPPKRVHVVQPGEWLAKIAQDHGVDLRALFRLNPHLGPMAGRSFDRIFPGDVVNLPQPAPTASAGDESCADGLASRTGRW